MVKLSRRGASNGRSRRSLKKRSSRTRMMKGGAYDGPDKIYNRMKLGSTLYELSITSDDADNKVYTLDFGKAKGAVVDTGMKIFKRNESIANEYSDAFIKAFGIMDTVNTNAIKVIIGKLFAQGVDGAKQRKLIITEKSSSVDIKLTKDGDTEDEVTVTKSTFEDYLRSLGDGIMPSTTQ
jgi:hypothetical protein